MIKMNTLEILVLVGMVCMARGREVCPHIRTVYGQMDDETPRLVHGGVNITGNITTRANLMTHKRFNTSEEMYRDQWCDNFTIIAPTKVTTGNSTRLMFSVQDGFFGDGKPIYFEPKTVFYDSMGDPDVRCFSAKNCIGHSYATVKAMYTTFFSLAKEHSLAKPVRCFNDTRDGVEAGKYECLGNGMYFWTGLEGYQDDYGRYDAPDPAACRTAVVMKTKGNVWVDGGCTNRIPSHMWCFSGDPVIVRMEVHAAYHVLSQGQNVISGKGVRFEVDVPYTITGQPTECKMLQTGSVPTTTDVERGHDRGQAQEDACEETPDCFWYKPKGKMIPINFEGTLNYKRDVYVIDDDMDVFNHFKPYNRRCGCHADNDVHGPKVPFGLLDYNTNVIYKDPHQGIGCRGVMSSSQADEPIIMPPYYAVVQPKTYRVANTTHRLRRGYRVEHRFCIIICFGDDDENAASLQDIQNLQARLDTEVNKIDGEINRIELSLQQTDRILVRTERSLAVLQEVVSNLASSLSSGFAANKEAHLSIRDKFVELQTQTVTNALNIAILEKEALEHTQLEFYANLYNITPNARGCYELDDDDNFIPPDVYNVTVPTFEPVENITFVPNTIEPEPDVIFKGTAGDWGWKEWLIIGVCIAVAIAVIVIICCCCRGGGVAMAV